MKVIWNQIGMGRPGRFSRNALTAQPEWGEDITPIVKTCRDEIGDKAARPWLAQSSNGNN
jgi:hypothetical protein